MDLKRIGNRIKNLFSKYKYAAVVLIIGLLLLVFPTKKTENIVEEHASARPDIQTFDSDSLAKILQSVDGAGDVKVLLSVASGEQTEYQIDSDISNSGDASTSKTETVIVTDSARNEAGLIKQVNPPTYLGAVVVCEGADSAAVRLAITQAVSKITGLGADCICVLKMK